VKPHTMPSLDANDTELPFELPEGFYCVEKHECPNCRRPLEYTFVGYEASGAGFGVVDGRYLFMPTTLKDPGPPNPHTNLKETLELCGVRQVDCIGTEACSLYRGPEKGHEGVQVYHSFWTMEVDDDS